MMIQQLTLWDEPAGTVWFDGTVWCATIGDWWYATGKTEKDAIKKVIEMYKKERTMPWNG